MMHRFRSVFGCNSSSVAYMPKDIGLREYFCRLLYWSHGIELVVEYILTIHLVSLLTWVHHGNFSFSYAHE